MNTAPKPLDQILARNVRLALGPYNDDDRPITELIVQLRNKLIALAPPSGEGVGTLNVWRHVGGDDGECEYHFSGKIPPGAYVIVPAKSTTPQSAPVIVTEEMIDAALIAWLGPPYSAWDLEDPDYRISMQKTLRAALTTPPPASQERGGIPWGSWDTSGRWFPNTSIAMSGDEQYRQNVENGYIKPAASPPSSAAEGPKHGSPFYVEPLPDRVPSLTNSQQGLYRKFEVRRTDGSDQPGGKHHGCEYFVLDVNHDEHAQAALNAYQASVAKTHPQLARDMRDRYGLQPDAAEQAKPVSIQQMFDAEQAQAVELPPLPEPYAYDRGLVEPGLYTAKQMRDYANACRLAGGVTVDKEMVDRGMDGAWNWTKAHADYDGAHDEDWRSCDDKEAVSDLRGITEAVIVAALGAK